MEVGGGSGAGICFRVRDADLRADADEILLQSFNLEPNSCCQ